MKKTTVVLGAGAVLDFDFSNITFPSTQNITNKIANLKVQGLYQDQSEIISDIFKSLNESGNQIYIQRDLHQQFKYQVNFEELFFVIESLYSFNGTFKNEYLSPKIRPLISTMVEPNDEIQHFPSIEFNRALYLIIKEIVEIIDQYDSRFSSDAKNELWYRKFWAEVPNRWDIFTFNYDNTIEESLQEYEDGFEPSFDGGDYEHFNPVKLMTNPKDLATIHHMHGCTRYGELNPKSYEWINSYRDMYKTRSVNDAIKYLGIQTSPYNQANERFINSPIIIGLRKLDKLTYLPFSFYHANLVNKIMANSGLLIIGYSFGDLYANELIKHHSLIHGNQQRVVLIDKFPEYIESRSQLYRYLNNNISVGTQEFIKLQMKYHITDDFKIEGLNIDNYDLPIYSDDGRCMLLICGFKKAVEKHKETMIDFLI